METGIEFKIKVIKATNSLVVEKLNKLIDQMKGWSVDYKTNYHQAIVDSIYCAKFNVKNESESDKGLYKAVLEELERINKTLFVSENTDTLSSIKKLLHRYDCDFVDLGEDILTIFNHNYNRQYEALKRIEELAQCSDDRFAQYSDIINIICKEALK